MPATPPTHPLLRTDKAYDRELTKLERLRAQQHDAEHRASEANVRAAEQHDRAAAANAVADGKPIPAPTVPAAEDARDQARREVVAAKDAAEQQQTRALEVLDKRRAKLEESLAGQRDQHRAALLEHLAAARAAVDAYHDTVQALAELGGQVGAARLTFTEDTGLSLPRTVDLGRELGRLVDGLQGVRRQVGIDPRDVGQVKATAGPSIGRL